MSHVLIVGGGSALAQPLIQHYLAHGCSVTAICRERRPTVQPHRKLHVIDRIDMATEDARAVLSTLTYPVDLLITLMGSTANAKLEDMTLSQWSAVILSSLTSVFQSLRYGLPKVVSGGSAVVVGSVVGSLGGKGCANYAAAKSGLVGLVRAAANEYAYRGVRCNLLELGYCDAGMGSRLPENVREKVLASIPMGRFATELEVVEAVDFLSRAYMSGDVLTLAGGLR